MSELVLVVELLDVELLVVDVESLVVDVESLVVEPPPPEVAEVVVGSPPLPAAPPEAVSLALHPDESPSARAELTRRAVIGVSLRRFMAER